MSNTKIVEIIPDNMPRWMSDAMDSGQLFNAVIAHVAELEGMRDATVIIDNRLKRFSIAWAFILGAILNKDVIFKDVPVSNH